MTEPSYAIQKAVFEALIAAQITGVGARIHDRVLANAILPYVLIGDDLIEADDDAGDFFDVQVEVEAYAATRAQLKLIVAGIHTALNRILTLDGFGVHTFEYAGVRYETVTNGSDQVELATISFDYLVQRLP